MNKKSALVIASLVSATCLLAKTMTDYDHTADFGKYHTYSWIGVNAQEPLWQERIQTDIDNQLTAKGWQKVASGGDAAVSALGSSHNEQAFDTFYTGGFGGGWFHRGWGGWGGPGFATTQVENIPVGTLHIDIFDAQTKKVVWHAVATDTLSSKPDKNEKKLENAVTDAFKKFPPPPKG